MSLLQKDEEKRLQEEKRKAEQERQRMEKERKDREVKEAELREKKAKERASQIDQQRPVIFYHFLLVRYLNPVTNIKGD